MNVNCKHKRGIETAYFYFYCDIVSHLDAAVQYADLLEERPLTIDFGDYEMSFE